MPLGFLPTLVRGRSFVPACTVCAHATNLLPPPEATYVFSNTIENRFAILQAMWKSLYKRFGNELCQSTGGQAPAATQVRPKRMHEATMHPGRMASRTVPMRPQRSEAHPYWPE